MSEPLPLSLVIITRDAAHELADCLASAAFAAETIVVDSGSRDDTVALAAAPGRARDRARMGRLRPAEELRGRRRRSTTGCCASTPTSASRPSSRRPFARRSRRALPRRRPTRSRAATASSAAGSRTARAIRTGTCGCSTAGARAGPTTRSTKRSSPTARWRGLHGDLLHASAESIDAYIAKQNRYTTVQAAAMHAARRARQRLRS